MENTLDNKLVFEILGIEKTRDEAVIKSAYRMKLVETNPEDKPHEFMMLRKAYEQALNFAMYGDENQDESELEKKAGMNESEEDDTSSPIAVWLSKVKSVYASITKRMDESQWKKILEDSILSELEYSHEAKIRFLQFIADNFRLSNEVYRLINESLGIEENQNELKEYLPEEFVDYMIRRVHDDGNMDFPWEWFEGDEYADYDSFFGLQRMLEEQVYTNDVNSAMDTIMKMEELNITHPFFEIEKIRLNVLIGKTDMVEEQVERIIDRYPDSVRVPLLGAQAIWNSGNHHKAIEIFKQMKEKEDNFLSDKYLAIYAKEQGDYDNAIEYAEECLKLQYDDEVSMMLRELNAMMLKEYENTLPAMSDEAERYIKACLDTDETQKGIDFLLNTEFIAELINGYGYLAELYMKLEQWDMAMDASAQWIESLNDKDNKDEVYKKLAAAHSMSARAAYCLAKNEECDNKEELLDRALENARKSVSMEKDGFWVNYRILLVDILTLQENYEDAYEEISKILEVYPNVYFLIERKQKICYELGRAQEVVDAYFTAKEIYSRLNDKDEFKEETIHLYERAAEVFDYYSQYSNVESVLESAEEIGINSYELASKRAAAACRLMRKTGKYKHAMSALEQVNKAIEMNEQTINERMDRCGIYLDIKDYEKSLEEAKRVVEMAPEYNWGYHFLAKSYYHLKEYEKCIENEKKAIELMGEAQSNADFFVTIGLANVRMGKYDEAERWYRKGIDNCENKRRFYNRLIDIAQESEDYEYAGKLMEESYENGCYANQWEYMIDKLYMDCVMYNHKEEYTQKYVRYIEELVQEHDDDAELVNELADAYMIYSDDMTLVKDTYYKAYRMAMEDENLDKFSTKKNVIHLMELCRAEGDMEKTREYGKVFDKLICDIYEEEDVEQAHRYFLEDIYGGKSHYYDMGVYWVYMGEIEKAKQCVSDLAKRDRCRTCIHKDCTDLFELMAIIAEAEGKYEEALRLYEKSHEFDKFNKYAAWKVNKLKNM